jgi:hypothetical protein
MDAGDLNAMPRRGFAYLLALAHGNIVYRVRQGEGGDFHSSVTDLRGIRQGVFDFPALKYLVANGEFHPR